MPNYIIHTDRIERFHARANGWLRMPASADC